MRKALLLFAVLIICGIAGLFPLGSYVLAESDQIQITENVISGDKSLVEGVTIKLGSHMDRHLYWDTVYVAGKEPSVNTQYEYYSERKYDTTYRFTYDGVCFEGLPNFGSSGTSVASVGDRIGFKEAYEMLEEETQPGAVGTKTLPVKEYYKYYPTWVSVETEYFSYNYSGVFWSGASDEVPDEERERVQAAFAEFFKIPVLEEERYIIELRKNEDGDVVEIGGTPDNDWYTGNGTDSFVWQTATAWTEEYCYFTFVPYSFLGKEMDTSLIPGGFGIYRLPFEKDENGDYYVKPEELTMVYALEKGQVKDGVSLEISPAGDLLLITENEETVVLSALDQKTLELKQELLIERAAEERVVIWYQADDFMVWRLGERLLVMDWTEDRGYKVQFIIPIEKNSLIREGADSQRTGNVFDWNGEQLIYAVYGAAYAEQIQNKYYDCDFSLAVYDATGEIYLGEYKSSQYTEKEREEDFYNDKRCEARHSILEVEWGK